MSTNAPQLIGMPAYTYAYKVSPRPLKSQCRDGSVSNLYQQVRYSQAAHDSH